MEGPGILCALRGIFENYFFSSTHSTFYRCTIVPIKPCFHSQNLFKTGAASDFFISVDLVNNQADLFFLHMAGILRAILPI